MNNNVSGTEDYREGGVGEGGGRLKITFDQNVFVKLFNNTSCDIFQSLIL